MTWMRWSRAPSVSLQMTPSWAGRLCRETWTGWIQALRPVGWGPAKIKLPDPALGSQQFCAVLHTAAEWLETGPVEKDLGMLVDIQLIAIQLCTQVAKKAKGSLVFSNSVASTTRAVTVPLYLALLRLHLEFQFWALTTSRTLRC